MGYRNVILSLSEGLISVHLEHHREQHSVDAREIAAEILIRQSVMPPFVRLPIYLLTWLFDWWGLFRGGRRFQAMVGEHRANQILAWKYSRVGLCRNLMRFYESLFLLIALQEP